MDSPVAGENSCRSVKRISMELADDDDEQQGTALERWFFKNIQYL
jgi:hypothetical protein